MGELGFEIKQHARAEVLIEEALKTSEIEGQPLDPAAVRSSVGDWTTVALSLNATTPTRTPGGCFSTNDNAAALLAFFAK
jgi:hypothetical protein